MPNGLPQALKATAEQVLNHSLSGPRLLLEMQSYFSINCIMYI